MNCNETSSSVPGYSESELKELTLFNLTLIREMNRNMNTFVDMITQDPSEMPSQQLLRGISKQRKPMLTSGSIDTGGQMGGS